MSAHDHHTIHRAYIHHGWNNAFPPKLKIAPGEIIRFETRDPSSGQLSPASRTADIATLDFPLLRTQEDWMTQPCRFV